MPDTQQIDTAAARDILASLASAIDSMSFAAPEVIGVHQQRAADLLNLLASSLGLTRK